MTNPVPELSVVVPLFNEEESVPPLVERVRASLIDTDWELILVDDGSSDATPGICRREAMEDPRVRFVGLARNFGQTMAMQAGFDEARAPIIVSMDGDLQNDPKDIPMLVDKLEEGYDLVAGYRMNRKDSFLSRKLPSLVANRIIRLLTGVNIRDNGCSLKAYRRSVVERLHLYSELHRFIPAVAAGTSGARITEVPVRHHPRQYGSSKYGLSRTWRVILDLFTVAMIRWFRERPVVMFGSAALASALLGFAFVAATAASVAFFTPYKATAVVFPGTALLFFGLAGYLLMLGLVGEAALHWKWSDGWGNHGGSGSR